MVRFEELQDLWKKQAAPAGGLDTGPLTIALRQYSRRQNLINFSKLGLVLLLVNWGRIHVAGSAWSLSGLAILAMGTLVLVLVDWRRQRAIAKLNFAEPSSEFLRNAIRRLSEQRDPFQKQYWPLVLTAITGINLLYFGVLRNSSTGDRLLLHLFGTVMPFAACELGRRIRARRFEAECRPVMDRLVAMQKALEERSQ